MRWANGPEEVPEWDGSRGYSGFEADPDPNGWEELKRAFSFRPRRTPPLEEEFPHLHYPRLVWSPAAYQPSGKRLTVDAFGWANKLTALRQHLDMPDSMESTSLFAQEVLRLANAYTPYTKHFESGYQGLTLRDWAIEVVHADIALQVAHRLKEVAEPYAVVTLKEVEEWVMQRATVSIPEWAHRAGESFIGRAWPPSLWHFYLPALVGSGSVAQAKRNLARLVYDPKGIPMRCAYLEEADLPTLVARGGFGDWAAFEISQTIQRRAVVKICSVCGRAFVGKSKKGDTCIEPSTCISRRSRRKGQTV